MNEWGFLGRCLLAALLFALLARPCPAQTSQNPDAVDLDPQIIIILDRHQQTLDAVQSLEATFEILEHRSFKGIGSRTLKQTVRTWWDGQRLRTDTLESKFIGEQTAPLLLSKDAQSATYYQPPPVGAVEIHSVESSLAYDPDLKRVYVTNPKWDKDNQLSKNTLLKFQSILYGFTLPETIRAITKQGLPCAISNDAVETEDCILFSFAYGRDEDQAMKVWVVPSKGYCIKKYQNYYRNEVVEEYTTSLKEYTPGLWWFDAVKVMYSEKTHDGSCLSTVSVAAATISKSIDPNIFTLAATNVPYGTPVSDDVIGLKYVYGSQESFTPDDLSSVRASLKNATPPPHDNPDSQGPADVTPNRPHSLQEDAESSQHPDARSRSSGPLLQIAIGILLIVVGFAIFAIVRRSRNPSPEI